MIETMEWSILLDTNIHGEYDENIILTHELEKEKSEELRKDKEDFYHKVCIDKIDTRIAHYLGSTISCFEPKGRSEFSHGRDADHQFLMNHCWNKHFPRKKLPASKEDWITFACSDKEKKVIVTDHPAQSCIRSVLRMRSPVISDNDSPYWKSWTSYKQANIYAKEQGYGCMGKQ
jgi:hypothetical protein